MTSFAQRDRSETSDALSLEKAISKNVAFIRKMTKNAAPADAHRAASHT